MNSRVVFNSTIGAVSRALRGASCDYVVTIYVGHEQERLDASTPWDRLREVGGDVRLQFEPVLGNQYSIVEANKLLSCLIKPRRNWLVALEQRGTYYGDWEGRWPSGTFALYITQRGEQETTVRWSRHTSLHPRADPRMGDRCHDDSTPSCLLTGPWLMDPESMENAEEEEEETVVQYYPLVIVE